MSKKYGDHHFSYEQINELNLLLVDFHVMWMLPFLFMENKVGDWRWMTISLGFELVLLNWNFETLQVDVTLFDLC
jgi:hypothetical protein